MTDYVAVTLGVLVGSFAGSMIQNWYRNHPRKIARARAVVDPSPLQIVLCVEGALMLAIFTLALCMIRGWLA